MRQPFLWSLSGGRWGLPRYRLFAATMTNPRPLQEGPSPADRVVAGDPDMAGRPSPGITRLAASVGLATLIAGLTIAVRTYAFRDFSPFPTGFDGPLAYREHYYLDHHA